jgi:hypothetical protein
MKDRLSLAVDHILGEESDFTPPSFPPEDVPPGAPPWMYQWVSEGLCINCEGRGYINLPGTITIECPACDGTRTRRGYLNA